MKKTPPIPTALQIVAVLFLLDGIGTAIGMAASLIKGRAVVELGVLGIPAFFGLRRLSLGWWVYALVYIWINLAMFAVVLYQVFRSIGPAVMTVFNFPTISLSRFWILAMILPVILLQLWQHRVLTRRENRDLFFVPRNK